MLPVRFDDIGSADIQKLVNERTSERKTLEYKLELKIDNKDETAEFLADISSFANASGGDIIFGISDERDDTGKATGIPGVIVPLEIKNADTQRGRIAQTIETGIQPRIPGVQVKVLTIPPKGHVIVIRVPRSWIGPHMVSYANRTRFFSRNGISGKQQLDVQQIGEAFAQQRGLGERLREWKTERISRAIAAEGPVPLEGSQILFHFVSAATLTDRGQSLPRIFDTQGLWKRAKLFYRSTHGVRYNADGILLVSGKTMNNGQSYLQIFRDGTLEYGDSALLKPNDSGLIPSQLLEEKFIQTFANAVVLLKEIETPEPIFVSLTMTGMRGRLMGPPQHEPDIDAATPFDRDIIMCPDMPLENLNEGRPYASTLLPIVNALWQAAGLERTPYGPILWSGNS